MTDQKILSARQIEIFYHDFFVKDQVEDFVALAGPPAESDGGPGVVVDVGGGCGFFAKSLRARSGLQTRVIDTDPRSIEECSAAGVDASLDDALMPQRRGDESFVTFNLMLHHLVGSKESHTRRMQVAALRVWHDGGVRVFVNEYIYDSFFGDLSGRLIYGITSSRVLSAVARVFAKVMPSLYANTFGVGVRFRSREEWIRLFRESGFRVSSSREGRRERVTLPMRALLIREVRRDSFLLTPAEN